jgi:hypothetical protein
MAEGGWRLWDALARRDGLGAGDRARVGIPVARVSQFEVVMSPPQSVLAGSPPLAYRRLRR